MATSTSSASGSTSTVADDVWMRPWLSVTGTRCTRCVPPSYLKRGQAPSPCTENVTSLTPPRSLPSSDSVSTFSPWRAGVGPVHVVEVAGEQVGLLAALGAADLDDHVAPGVRVGRAPSARAAPRRRRPGRRAWRPSSCLERRPLVAGGLGEQLAGRVGVGRQRPAPPGGVDDRVELAVAGRDPAQLGRVGGDAPDRPGGPRGRRAPAPWRRGGRARRRTSRTRPVEATRPHRPADRADFLSCD